MISNDFLVTLRVNTFLTSNTTVALGVINLNFIIVAFMKVYKDILDDEANKIIAKARSKLTVGC